MKPAHPAIALCFLAAALAIGCSAGSPADGAERTSHSEQALLGICQPLTCCFPSGGNWTPDPFEDGLRSLGCDKPQAYTQSYGQSQWWLYSMCPPSLELVDLVAEYALVSPYYSQLVVNECLEAHAAGQGSPTDVFVEWDPTCSSCCYY